MLSEIQQANGSASAGPFAYSWGLINTLSFDWEIKTVTAADRNRDERRRVIRGIGERNPQQVPEDTNSFLTDEAKLALGKFCSPNEQAKTNKCSTRRILLSNCLQP